MKKWVTNIFRKSNFEDKTKYRLVLSQNERNIPLPQELFSNFINSLTHKDLFFYPNTFNLQRKLTSYHGIKSEQLLLTNGSDGGLRLLFELFDLTSKNVITTQFHFPMYSVYSEINNCELLRISYTEDRYNIQDIIKAINPDTKFVILANPNSPIGDYHSIQEFEPLLNTGVTVIVDEAYIELCDKPSLVNYVDKYPNLIILRTFSKGFGAAGIRVGYIIANAELINALSKITPMYEISSISTKYCEYILDNIEYYSMYLKSTMEKKQQAYTFLEKSKNLRVKNTDSSWFFIQHKQDNKILSDFFSYNSIAIRTINLDSNSTNTEWYKFNYDLAVDSLNIVEQLADV